MRVAHNKGKTKVQPGQAYGSLTVVERIPNKGHDTRWKCLCICGNYHKVSGGNLFSGRTKSCGCVRDRETSEQSTTHGMSKSPLYAVWNAMLGRCHNPKNKQYPDYGARGIHVCDRWKMFDNFYEDMGDPPKGCSLERVDNNKGYSPENCKWATRKEQSRNKRNTRKFEFNGEMLVLQDIAAKLGITRNTLNSRINLYGWTPEQAFSTQVMSRSESARLSSRKARGRSLRTCLTMTQENLT